MRTLFFYAGFAYIFLLGAGSVFGFTELAGDLPNEITAEKSPYLVVADIFVPTGKTVRIEPGTVFLFNNFTGLHIHGILTALGTITHPIIFTSAYDHSFVNSMERKPTPYDWNGIYIQKDGMGTDIANFKVRYSVKGIVSETKYITLKSGNFSDNGRSHCTIEGVEQNVVAGAAFSHAASLKDAEADGVPITILEDPLAPRRNIIRYCGVAVLLGGVAIGGVYGMKYQNSRAEFHSLQSKDTLNTIPNFSDDYYEGRDQRNKDLAGTIAGGVLALLGCIGVVWTFTF